MHPNLLVARADLYLGLLWFGITGDRVGVGTVKTLPKSRRGNLETSIPHTSPVDLTKRASHNESVLESQKMMVTVVPT